MSSQLSAARETHLQSSSEVLLFTSPSISAYLQTQKTNTSETNTKPQKTNGSTSDEMNTPNPQICSCGRKLLPGYNSKIKPFGQKRTRKDRLEGKSASKSLTCSICNAIHILQARHTVRRTKAPHRTEGLTKAKTPFAPPIAQSTPTTVDAEPETSATRKRSRNKKSSLQAMLAERKSGSTSVTQGFGLGLGDFMK